MYTQNNSTHLQEKTQAEFQDKTEDQFMSGFHFVDYQEMNLTLPSTESNSDLYGQDFYSNEKIDYSRDRAIS